MRSDRRLPGLREGMTSRPQLGVAAMLEPDFWTAAFPLLESGAVDVLEWSFDTAPNGVPEWLGATLDQFADAGALLAHGVSFSPLSGGWHDRQVAWLELWRREAAARPYRWVSEHFGFMTAGETLQGSPFPVPMDARSLRVGRDRLVALAEHCTCPVGLENLAFAFGTDDVARQGEFLDALLDPVDGFLVLDLHNLYCQAVNFDRAPDELMMSYPLQRVRELHVSGGSWSEHRGRRIRRDTHDDGVPEEVLAMLATALRQCPSVEVVILERLGGTLIFALTAFAGAAGAFVFYRRLKVTHVPEVDPSQDTSSGGNYRTL